MKRRTFIAGLASAVARPVVARAQQPAMPVIGYLSPATAGSPYIAGFRKGLSEVRFIEGRNIVIEYRFANNVPDRLPELAADLVRRRVNVIATIGMQASVAAKGATATIPIVFRTGADPVRYGLVALFNKPGSNITGINDITLDLGPKRLGLLRELLPKASRLAILGGPGSEEAEIADVQTAASNIGMPVEVIKANTSPDIDLAFRSLVQKGIDALFVTNDPLFFTRRVQVVILAAYYRLPATYAVREYPEIGGLASYGVDFSDQYRLVGIYTGRILQGEKPSEMPVLRPTKFEFIINLQTAKTLRIDVPETLLATADEVIQ